jgi:hypothetical protein
LGVPNKGASSDDSEEEEDEEVPRKNTCDPLTQANKATEAYKKRRVKEWIHSQTVELPDIYRVPGSEMACVTGEGSKEQPWTWTSNGSQHLFTQLLEFLEDKSARGKVVATGRYTPPYVETLCALAGARGTAERILLLAPRVALLHIEKLAHVYMKNKSQIFIETTAKSPDGPLPPVVLCPIEKLADVYQGFAHTTQRNKVCLAGPWHCSSIDSGGLESP